MNPTLEYEATSIEDARQALESTLRATVALPPARAAEAMRAASPPPAPDVPLAAVTEYWMASLPEAVAPRELARTYPRVANELCALWRRPSRCEVYLEKLILDDRQGRAGFPLRVMAELGALAAHYAALYPPPRQSVWNMAHAR